MLLIVIGGIGFLTWDDICKNKLPHFHRCNAKSRGHSRYVLTLIVLPALFSSLWTLMPFPRSAVQAALFQSVRRERRASTQSIYPPCRRIAGRDDQLRYLVGSPGSGRRRNHHAGSSAFQCCATFISGTAPSSLGAESIAAPSKPATILTMYLACSLAEAFLSACMKISRFTRLLRNAEAASAREAVGLTCVIARGCAVSLANGIDRTDVSGQSRGGPRHLCGGVQQKKAATQSCHGKES